MSRVVDWVEAALLRLGALSGFGTLLIMVVVCLDVAGRAALNAPFHSGVEVSELLLVSLVFLGLAAAQQQKQHFAVEIVARHLPPGLRRGLELAGLLACLGITAVIAWPSTRQAAASFDRGETGFGIVPFPVWPARAILALGLWLLAVQFACDAYRLVAGGRGPEAAAPPGGERP
jgi:TRAP-type C4-dicarboxylate transport system permease small subunit